MKSLAILVLILVVIAAIKIVESKRSKESSTKKAIVYKYQHKEYLITRTEHDFFNILVEVVGSNYYIFPQECVRLLHLLIVYLLRYDLHHPAL